MNLKSLPSWHLLVWRLKDILLDRSLRAPHKYHTVKGNLSPHNDRLLTIFVPSYNRFQSLDATLESIFTAMDEAKARNLIDVLVVDDYSSDPIEGVIAKHRNRGNNVNYQLHRQPCGVAEIAMLRCLQYIHTRYAWCVGNDDLLLPDALTHLLPILNNSGSSFFLLNLLGAKNGLRIYDYFGSAEEILTFPRGADFFQNFGFVTSTTTFPCLCFEVEPLRRLDLESITETSPIYSHTAAFYCAFYDLPCSFISRPMILFNHNDLADEYSKLVQKNVRLSRPNMYHATVGLARHLLSVAQHTGTSLHNLLIAREDELNKNTNRIKTSITCFFILSFILQQLRYELEAVDNSLSDVIFFTAEELNFLQQFFISAGFDDLKAIVLEALDIYNGAGIPVDQKRNSLLGLLGKTFELEKSFLHSLESSYNSVGYIVYGQQSGVRLLLDDRPRSEHVSMVAFLAKEEMVSAQTNDDHKFIVLCEAELIHEDILHTLAGLAMSTSADLIVFNNFTGEEEFLRLFVSSRFRSYRYPINRMVWRRNDLSIGRLRKRLKTRQGDFTSGMMIRPHWLRSASPSSDRRNPTVEFVNWRIFR
jgi:glycosyltransferase involved in cell wall biosynthesis